MYEKLFELGNQMSVFIYYDLFHYASEISKAALKRNDVEIFSADAYYQVNKITLIEHLL